MGFERAVGGSAPNVAALPAVRPPRAIRLARIEEADGPSATSGGTVVFDEAVDIQLGFDRPSGRLAIVGGDVRVEARLAGQPSPGSLGTASPESSANSVGSLVNFTA